MLPSFTRFLSSRDAKKGIHKERYRGEVIFFPRSLVALLRPFDLFSSLPSLHPFASSSFDSPRPLFVRVTAARSLVRSFNGYKQHRRPEPADATDSQLLAIIFCPIVPTCVCTSLRSMLVAREMKARAERRTHWIPDTHARFSFSPPCICLPHRRRGRRARSYFSLLSIAVVVVGSSVVCMHVSASAAASVAPRRDATRRLERRALYYRRSRRCRA